MSSIRLIKNDVTTEYSELSEAINNLEDGSTIILDEDISPDSVIRLVGVKVNLDLNGHTINPSHNSDVFWIYQNGGLTLEDSVGGGWIISRNSCVTLGASDDYDDPNGFTMYSGGLESQEFTVAIFGGGVVNIHGGTLISHDNGNVGANGSKKYADYPYTINITGGNFRAETQSAGYANCSIYASNAGVVNISGGTIEGVDGAGIVVRGGDVNVSSGTIIGSGSTEGKKMGDANPTYCGGIEICNAANYPGKIGTCVIYGGTIVSKHNSAALVIGDPNNPDYPNSINSSVVITGGEFNGINSVGFITKQGQPIEEAQNSNLVIYGGTFTSDVSDFLDDSLQLEKVVKEDGTVVYQVAKTISDVIDEIQEVEDQLLEINNIEVQQVGILDDIQSNQVTLQGSVNSIDSSINSLVSDVSTSLDNEIDILSAINTSNNKLDSIITSETSANQTLDQIVQDLEAANTGISEISSISTNIKSDTTSIKSSTNGISNTVDSVSDSLETLIKVNKKIFEEVSKINGDDPSDIDTDTHKDEKAIETLQIRARINDCKLTGQKAFIWNHKMSDTVKEYCESKNCSISKPEYLGGQYLIIVSE